MLAFSAAVAGVNRFSNLRPFVQMEDMLGAMKMMKSLNPEIVPGHCPPGTTKIFNDSIQYYALLMEGVEKMAREGRPSIPSRRGYVIPETEGSENKNNFPTNIDAAYRGVKGK